MQEEQLLSQALTAIRRSLPLNSWSQFADAIVEDRRRRQAHLVKTEPNRSWFGLLDQLRGKGFTKLPTTLSGQEIREIRAYFEANPVHKGPHIYSFDGRPKRMDEARRDFSMAGYRFDQVVRAPHLVDTFNDPQLIDFIEAYFGCVPTLYSMNAWWSFPATRPELIHSQHFHRDIDDWRFVTLFLYLTDVDLIGGPHQVIEGSQTLDGVTRLASMARAMGRDVGGFDPAASFVNTAGEDLSRTCERLFKEFIFNATGPAGTMWLVNTMALHRGLMPTTEPRLIVWARYGLGPSVNSADIEQGPIARRLIPTALADTPRNRFVNRLLFDFDRGPANF
jgi:hypothetical protein